MRVFLGVGVLVACTVTAVGLASPLSWQLVKRGKPAGEGQLAVVGAIVVHPGRVAVRVTVADRRSISVSVVMSCRKGIRTGIGHSRLVQTAPYTTALRLPFGGADNCAVSATGRNPGGALSLELLRSG